MGTVALTMMTFSACLLLTQRRVGVGDLPTTAEGTAGRPHHFQRFERVDLADAVQIFYKKGALLVDVREERYFTNGHVRGAVNIPLSVLARIRPPLLARITNAPVVLVYCGSDSCQESSAAAALLASHKPRNLAIYSGGWQEWKSCRLPIECGGGEIVSYGTR